MEPSQIHWMFLLLMLPKLVTQVFPDNLLTCELLEGIGWPRGTNNVELLNTNHVRDLHDLAIVYLHE